MTVAIPLSLLLFLLAFGMPIAFAMAVSGTVGLIMLGGVEMFMGIAQTTPIESVSSFLLSTIPMFILMAEFMTASGITKDLFRAGYKWLGHLPGGLGIATVFAGTGLAAVCGSSTASAATLAASAVPEMQRYGYKTHFAMGAVSIAGTLAIMIPPSVVLILYGILTETGIGSLLIAGIIPGVLTAVGYIITILIWVKKSPDVAPKIDVIPTMKERFQSLKNIWPMLLLVAIVVVSIYSGMVTATEAGAIGAFAAFLIALGMRRLTVKNILEALSRTLKSTSMILLIVMGAMFFGYYLTSTQVTQNLVELIQMMDIPRWIILMFIIILYLILGMFLDQIAILILTLPFTFPLIIALGYDPVWFGIIVTKTAEIGLVTPPVGMNVFVASGSAGVPTAVGFKGVFWFVVADLFILLLLILFPFLSTWLPGLMM
ncbi:TRAP transporter large permease [Aneurinibacillus sp. UBA3580]|jgi:tripartite ATP-independent transporter DctM subunit|uniref:TRAP transporter large permease n=1 Tax=Aneurinibacillus sp. UBA3580 TaxID=1946041 RepID=UPI00257BFC91|nr:TRAP transporter large permease [Aneurinibacillus sp. UBA3580]